MNSLPVVYVTSAELLIRVTIAIVVTFTFVVMVRGLHHRWLAPRPLFGYMTTCIGIMALMRWTIVWLSFISPEQQAPILMWFSPMHAVMIGFLSLSILLMVLYRNKEAQTIGGVAYSKPPDAGTVDG